MAINKLAPNTIVLSGGLPGAQGSGSVVNEYAAGAVITPGMLIELYNDAGKMKWRPQSVAADVAAPIIAIEKIEWNKGVDDTYAVGEMVNAFHMKPGTTWWAIIVSGQDISPAEMLQPDGTGKMQAAAFTTAAANVAHFQSLENLGAIVADTRCRVVYNG